MTLFFHVNNMPVVENMQKQLRNIEEVSIQPLRQFCKDIGIEFDKKRPKDLINKIIRKLSTNSDRHHLFVCDEIPCGHEDGEATPNWADLETAENVTCVLALRPDGNDDMQNLTPPSGPSIISRKLLHSHRNSYQIRSVSSGLFSFSYQ